MPRYMYIRVPKIDSLHEIVDRFEHRWRSPYTVGAMDGTHVRILWPLDSASDYYKRKGYQSILMQTVVDFGRTFM